MKIIVLLVLKEELILQLVTVLMVLLINKDYVNLVMLNVKPALELVSIVSLVLILEDNHHNVIVHLVISNKK